MRGRPMDNEERDVRELVEELKQLDEQDRALAIRTIRHLAQMRAAMKAVQS